MEKAWYQLTGEEVFLQLEVSTQGLTIEEVKQRQKKYGLNKLPKPKTLFKIFSASFLTP